MEHKHTPGPWHYWSGSVWTTPDGCEDGGACIARRDSESLIPGWERDSNLRLCAAAPDLLAACEELIRNFVPSRDMMTRDEAEVFDFAKDAIRKARGEA